MIKIIDIINEKFVTNHEILAVLFADTKAEVGTSSISNLPVGKFLAAGSKIEVADGSKGYLKSDGTWGWNTAGGNTNELPDVTADDNGDVLTVVDGAWAKASLPAPTPELPAVTPEDVGKVLTVDSDGNWVAVLPS